MPDAIILDRDGVLIKDKGFMHKVEELEFYPRVIEALQKVSKETKIIIITNQAGIARGIFTEQDYKKLRDHIHKIFRRNNIVITAEYFCPHHPKGTISEYTKECSCRKPASGLFEQAVKEHNLNPKNCWCIGDMRRDIIAGQRVGMKGIIVKTGFGGEGGEGDPIKPEYVAEDLYDAIKFIKKQRD
jgi:D-glycero-D-manno-heptose 1,7-bisphosphate phosphatase